MSMEMHPMQERVKTPFHKFVSLVRQEIETYSHAGNASSQWPPTLFFSKTADCAEVLNALPDYDTLRSVGWPVVRDVFFPQAARSEGARMIATLQHAPLPADLVDEDGVVTREVLVLIALDPWNRSAYRAPVIRDPTGEEVPRVGSWREMQIDEQIYEFISPLHQAICLQG